MVVEKMVSPLHLPSLPPVTWMPGRICYNPAVMVFPKKLRGLTTATILLAIYSLVWITLEGNLARVILLATGVTLVTGGYLVQGLLGGRQLSTGRWLIIAAAGGALMGPGVVVLSLVFMAVKTGLHAHGPEFSPAEISWIIQQIPLWMAVGVLAGLGFALLTIARYRPG